MNAGVWRQSKLKKDIFDLGLIHGKAVVPFPEKEQIGGFMQDV